MYNFSIIVPIFNTKKYLEECIESILKQEDKNLEIILINDGSVDGSAQICDSYKKIDSRIKVLHQINLGPSKARNVGLDIATGKYVMFIDSDDFLANTTVLSNFSAIFEKYNCDLIYGVYDGFIDENYNSCTYKIYPKILKINNEQIKNLDIEGVIELLFDNGNYYSSPTIKIYKRDYLEQYKFRFKENIYHEDEEWTPRILLNCKKIYFFNEQFYKRRIRSESIMTTNNDEKRLKKIISMIEIEKDMIEYTKINCKNNKLQNIFKNYFKDFRLGYMRLYGEIEEANIKYSAKVFIEEMESNNSKDKSEKV